MLVCVTSKGAGSPFSPSRVTHGRGHEEKVQAQGFFFSLGTKYGSNADGRDVNTFYGSSKSGQKILGDCLTREHDGTYSSCSENGNRVDLASIPKRK